MKPAPRVSVVVPTYNASARLDATVRAVLAQTMRPHEIIIIDDGSTDETGRLCAKFGDAIIYRRVANGGQQRARNLGAALATGDWIALLDHDDLWHPDYLAELAAFHAANDADLTISNGRDVREDGAEAIVQDPSRLTTFAPAGYWQAMGADPTARWSVLDRYDYAAYLAFHPAQPSVMTLSADLYRRLGGFDEQMRGSIAENVEFELRAIRAARVGLLWRPLVTIVNHAASASADSATAAVDIVDCLGFVLAHHDLSPTERDAVETARQQRLPRAIAAAFTLRRFDALRDYRRGLTARPNMKTRLKCAVAHLPRPVALAAANILTR